MPQLHSRPNTAWRLLVARDGCRCFDLQRPCHVGDRADKGLNMPPDNFEDWADLIGLLAEHLVQRYGLDEVSQWHFEVWK